MCTMEKLRVLELFCGIGGLHWALKETEVPFEVVGALEINPTVLETYAINFPTVNLMRRNIQSLTAEDINTLKIDTIIASPPCQPFCRTGHMKGLLDNRSSPLHNLLKILPDIKFKYIFVENVKGFENSDAHQLLLETLAKCKFKWQEFLINPLDLGVPNSRLRYYLIGKHSSLINSEDEESKWSLNVKSSNERIQRQLPDFDNNSKNPKLRKVLEQQKEKWNKYRKRQIAKSQMSQPDNSKWHIADILEPPENIQAEFMLPAEKVSKYWNAIDVVNPSSSKSCCFTKAYFQYLTGSGSILNVGSLENIDNLPNGLFRYFTPREISRLLCYPEEFQFPSNHTPKQLYKALGNSVNVYAVAIMFSLLF